MIDQNSPAFYHNKGNVAKLLGMGRLYVDKDGFLVDFGFLDHIRIPKRVKASEDVYELVCKGIGILDWVKRCSSFEIIRYRLEMQLVLYRNPEFGEIRQLLESRK